VILTARVLLETMPAWRSNLLLWTTIKRARPKLQILPASSNSLLPLLLSITTARPMLNKTMQTPSSNLLPLWVAVARTRVMLETMPSIGSNLFPEWMTITTTRALPVAIPTWGSLMAHKGTQTSISIMASSNTSLKLQTTDMTGNNIFPNSSLMQHPTLIIANTWVLVVTRVTKKTNTKKTNPKKIKKVIKTMLTTTNIWVSGLVIMHRAIQNRKK